jgi:hypothetical protein
MHKLMTWKLRALSGHRKLAGRRTGENKGGGGTHESEEVRGSIVTAGLQDSSDHFLKYIMWCRGPFY